MQLDIPITTPDEDVLDRNGFSERIAESIFYWKGDRSLVVVLNGHWGSGKTSIKNLIRYYLEQKGVIPEQMIEFNPWFWTDQEKLNSAFFKEVGLLFRKKKNDKNYKEIAEKWQLLENKLGFTQLIFTGTFKIAFFIVSVLIFIGIDLSSRLFLPVFSNIIIIIFSFLVSKDKLEQLLEILLRLESFFKTEYISNILQVFSSIGEKFEEPFNMVYVNDNCFKMGEIISNLLNRLNDSKKKDVIITDGLKKAEGLYIFAHFIMKKIEKEEFLNNLNTKMKDSFIEAITNAAKEGTLINMHNLKYLLITWEKLGWSEKCTEWAKTTISDFNSIVKFLKCFITKYSEQSGYIAKEYFEIDMENLQKWIIDTRELREKTNVDFSKLDKTSQCVIKLFNNFHDGVISSNNVKGFTEEELQNSIGVEIDRVNSK